jgi:hypothetical protein
MHLKLSLIPVLVLMATACGVSTEEGDSDDDSASAVARGGTKPIREAFSATCKKATGANRALSFQFMYDDDSQLRGTLLGPGSAELDLAVVKPADRTLTALQNIDRDDTVLRGANGGDYFVVSRFIQRFITSEDTAFAAKHNKIKVVSASGVVTEATCTPDAATETASQAIANIASKLSSDSYDGHGRTRAKLCTTVIERDPAGTSITVSIKPRKDDGSLGTTTSSITMNTTSTIKYSLDSKTKKVFFIQATTKEGSETKERLLTIEEPTASGRNVTIGSVGQSGVSTNFCDM